MKDFWDDLFFDLGEGGLTEETFAMKAGEDIRDSLRRIEDAIKDHNGKKALELIEMAKAKY